MDNGVPILPFYNDKSDCELKDLAVLLKNINLYHYKTKDCRDILRDIFRLQEITEHDNFQNIY